MADAVLTIASKTYSSWSLRAWLLCRMAGLDFEEVVLPSDDLTLRAESISPSFLVPRLSHGQIAVWDTLAIAEYLNERFPQAGLLPSDLAARTHCRAISAEMHAGFQNLRAALPLNLKAEPHLFSAWDGVKDDIERVLVIWRECLETYGGRYLFGARPVLADAMYAPVCARFRTYEVELDPRCADYCATILDWPLMREWIEAAKLEPDGADEELDIEF